MSRIEKLTQDLISELHTLLVLDVHPNIREILSSSLYVLNENAEYQSSTKEFNEIIQEEIDSVLVENQLLKDALNQARENWNQLYPEIDPTDHVFAGFEPLEKLEEILNQRDIDIESHDRKIASIIIESIVAKQLENKENVHNTLFAKTLSPFDLLQISDRIRSSKLTDLKDPDELLQELIQEGIDSGEGSTLDDEYFEKIRTQIENSKPETWDSVKERQPDSRTQQLRDLIDVLVDIVRKNNGVISHELAVRELAKQTGLPSSTVPYVINSAVADNRITSNLRTGVIRLWPIS